MKKRVARLIVILAITVNVIALPVFAENGESPESILQDFYWSEWSCEEPPEGSEYNEMRMYRYRIIETSGEKKEYTRWSEWFNEDEWVTKRVELESSLTETQLMDIDTVTKYRYKLPLIDQEITCNNTFRKKYGDNAFPLNATAETSLSYKSDNTDVADVSLNGTVTVKSAGMATITITAEKSGKFKSAEKTVIVTVSKITQTISGNTVIHKVYGDSKFNLGMSAKTKLTYSSSDKNIATVSSSGKVTLKNPSNEAVIITVKAEETDKYIAAVKKVKIKVSLKKPSLTISYNKKERKIHLKWNKVAGASKYQVYQYDYNKKKYILKDTGPSNAVGYSWIGKKGKTYKCKIRAYKVVNGEKVYSSFSSVKTVTAK